MSKEKLETKRVTLLDLGEAIWKEAASLGDLRKVPESSDNQELVDTIGGKIIIINEIAKIIRGYYGIAFNPYSIFGQTEKVRVGAKIKAEIEIDLYISHIKEDKKKVERTERKKDKRAKKRRQLMELIRILTKVKMRIKALEVMYGK